jgi:hypothetical protein
MAQIFSKLLTVTTGGTATTETVSGVNDAKLGTAFVAKAFVVFGVGAINTTAINTAIRMGFADATGAGWNYGGNESNDFGGKITRSGGGNVPIYLPSGSIFGGNQQVATISNIVAGAFDITYSVNYSGQSYAILALGGADLNVSVAGLTAALKQTTTWKPEAALFLYSSVSGSPNNGPSNFSAFGFAERNGATGAMALSDNSQGTGSRYQRTTKCIALLSDTPAVTDERAIVSWQTDGFTQDSAVASAFYYLALGGVRTAGGTLTQPTGSPATVTLTPGFDPIALLVFSCGKTAGTTIVTDCCQWSMGACDGVSSLGAWTNEDLQGNATPVHGAVRLSNADILQFCDAPAGAGSTMTAKAQVTAWNRSAGSITLDWSTVDAVAREYFWLALGAAGATQGGYPTWQAASIAC